MKKLATKYVTHGGNVTAPSHTEYSAYTFKGWDHSLSNIIENTNINTVYEYKKYKVQFKYNSTLMYETTVIYGQKAVYDGEPLLRTGYNFVWTDIDKAIYADTVLTGDYYLIDGYYQVRFFNETTQIGTTQMIKSGNDAVPPSNPTKDGWIFIEWNPSYKNIQKDTDCYACFNKIVYYLIFDGFNKDKTAFQAGFNIDVITQPLELYSHKTASGTGKIVLNEPFNSSFKNTANLTSMVDTGNGITSIAEYGFKAPTSLSYKKLTQLKTIVLNGVQTVGDYAFSGIQCLNNLQMNNATTLGICSFQDSIQENNCTLNFPKVTTIGEKTFKGCKKMTELSLGNVVNFQDFTCQDCASLTTVYIPKVTAIGANAFKNCKKITSMTLNNALKNDTNVSKLWGAGKYDVSTGTAINNSKGTITITWVD